MKKTLTIIIVLLICIASDQVTKHMAQIYIKDHPPAIFLNDTFRFQYAENRGAFLSMGALLPEKARFFIFTILPALVLVAMLTFLLTSSQLSRLFTISISMIIAGGIGNLIDRILYNGWVVDFMNMGIGSLRTGIFNVADLVIMIGLGLFIVDRLTDKKVKPTIPAKNN